MFSRFFLLIIVVSYGALFLSQEQQFKQMPPQISPALPAPIQEIVLGYLKEVGAELLFIKTAVFWGRSDLPKNHEEYADNLAQNLDVMTDIYPAFIDPYYLSESALAYINKASAASANDILLKGVTSHPEDIILPFFRGFNYFYYLDQPKEAAVIFAELATRPGAPTWFGHLAGILSARGGDLYGGLMTLKAMLATEEDTSMREKYQRSIGVFENAIRVHEAVEAFFIKNGVYPVALEELTPQFIDQIPELEDGFTLSWETPDLRLLRPIKKEKQE